MSEEKVRRKPWRVLAGGAIVLSLAVIAGQSVLSSLNATASAQRNDIVVLPVPDNAQLRYAHRVFEVSQQNGEILIKTKGVANPTPDAWTMSISSKEIPQAIAVSP